MANGISATIQRAGLELRPGYFLFGLASLKFLYLLYHNESFFIRSADPGMRPVVKRV